jgi:hypothetical protein
MQELHKSMRFLHQKEELAFFDRRDYSGLRGATSHRGEYIPKLISPIFGEKYRHSDKRRSWWEVTN